VVDLVIVQSRDQMPFRRPVRLRALADSDWVLNPTGCGYRAAIEMAMGRSLQIAIDAFGSELQLRLVAEGMGIGLVPRVTLAASPSVLAIHPVAVSDFNLTLDVRLAYRRESGSFKAVLAAIHAYAASALEG
jgi:DNA-binding transcriptional LysR family regulator